MTLIFNTLKHKKVCCQIKGANSLKLHETLKEPSKRWWLLHWRFRSSIDQSTFTSFVFHLESFPPYVVVALVNILSLFSFLTCKFDRLSKKMVLRGLKFVCMKELRVDWNFPAEMISWAKHKYALVNLSALSLLPALKTVKNGLPPLMLIFNLLITFSVNNSKNSIEEQYSIGINVRITKI